MTTPMYLPPLTGTNQARKRHFHNRATVQPCDRQISKQVWKKWRLTHITILNLSNIRKSEKKTQINVICYIILFLKAINALLENCSHCIFLDPEFAKKHRASSTELSIGFQNINMCGTPVPKYEVSRTALWSKSVI